jgi:hypothetical protein
MIFHNYILPDALIFIFQKERECIKERDYNKFSAVSRQPKSYRDLALKTEFRIIMFCLEMLLSTKKE